MSSGTPTDPAGHGYRVRTPVAFFIFNRPDLTETVFKAVAAARPPVLLVVADGPRNEREAGQCRRTRDVVSRVDWDCDVRTNFSEQNLGCGPRVSGGLDWVFQQAERAIVLEDDCLPSPAFFQFCDELLEKHEADERVMQVNGTKLHLGRSRTRYDYRFSRYTAPPWGWASWRRAWRHYDFRLGRWPELRQTEFLQLLLDDPVEAEYWRMRFDSVTDGTMNTWDYQWMFSCWLRGGLAAMPDHNLVRNLGFRADATHTVAARPEADQPVSDWRPGPAGVRHPPFVAQDRAADRSIFNHILGGDRMRGGRHFFKYALWRLSTVRHTRKVQAAGLDNHGGT